MTSPSSGGCLGHVIVLNERHLRRILSAYFAYYHRSRTHLSLEEASRLRYNRLVQAKLSLSRSSATFISVTNGSRPDPSRNTDPALSCPVGGHRARVSLTTPPWFPAPEPSLQGRLRHFWPIPWLDGQRHIHHRIWAEPELSPNQLNGRDNPAANSLAVVAMVC